MNPCHLERELELLERLVDRRLADYVRDPRIPVAPEMLDAFDTSLLVTGPDGRPPTVEEHVALLLGLVPHLQPDFFGSIISRHLPDGGDLPEIGGVRPEHQRGLIPTGETVQFVLGGTDLARRLEIQRLFTGSHWFAGRRLLWLEPVREGEAIMSGRLVLDSEIVEVLTTGTVSVPRFSTEFPAEHLDTEMKWDDVVLPPDTRRQIGEIERWIEFNDTLMHDWGMRRRVKPGFRVLFHGPPGTGKTLTASLLGKQSRRPVFRVDLSRVVSKFIGETEKNLARLFDKAEHKDWILFFDEADALFGKRTDIRDAHDKYANQEVAYLLQRIESYAGLIILATNRRENIDDAFLRRFQLAVQFNVPTAPERQELWSRALPEQITVADDVDWAHIADRYELTGANVLNVGHFCSLEALAEGTLTVDRRALETAIIRELTKEGRIV